MDIEYNAVSIVPFDSEFGSTVCAFRLLFKVIGQSIVFIMNEKKKMNDTQCYKDLFPKTATIKF